MSKSYLRNALVVMAFALPVAALADVTGTQTIPSGSTLNLDTNTIGTPPSGDILWASGSITPQGSATAVDLTNGFGSSFSGISAYNTITSALVSSLVGTGAGSSLSTGSFSPLVNDVIVVLTNNGDYAKLLVTAAGSSITVQFDTFTSSSSTPPPPSGPTIASVVNNYSYIPTGFPNSGIAPGSIFLIFGSGMSATPPVVALASSASPGIPKTLEGATLSVSVGGTTVQPAMYYATPTQIAAVLPSNTPTGSATITVTYNGATSNAFQFQVVPYALGINTYYGSGSGLILATDTGGSIFTYTNSAKPGQIIVMYGSGLGADTADSDTVFTSTPHAVNTPLKIYIGGVQASILYAGSSGYPGYDQLDVTIPDSVPLGCYVGVVGVTGTGSAQTVSNFGSLSIATAGGQCDDSVFGLSGTTVSTLGSQGTVSYGDLFVGQLINPTSSTNNTPKTENIAFAEFSKISGASFTSSSGSAYSVGSCFVSEVVSVSGSIPTIVGLDAGNIGLAGPNGSYTLMSFTKGEYEQSLPSGAITSSGGAFTFTGSGGADVGSFKTTINLPNPLLDWTNQAAGATVNRAQGVQVSWTGGTPGSYVIISGNAFNDNSGASGNFTCLANQSAGGFMVPGYVTSALPAASGTLGVENVSNYTTFSASGLNFGIAFGISGVTVNSVYQ
jgi:uncharacterized protein (TIGR03437 family)